jgi:hypothetical protein
MVRLGLGGSFQEPPPPHRSPPRKVEEKNWSQQARSRPPPKRGPSPSHCRSVLPIPPPWRPPDRGGQASRDDGSHAGPPQGFLTCATAGDRSPPASSLLASRFLADECNQPDCQRSSRSPDVRKDSTPGAHRLFIGFHRYHRPVQAAFWHLAPAVSIKTRVG